MRKRFKHSLSHFKLLTMNMGELVPISCMETIPGDSFQMASSVLLRVSPLLSPVYHPVNLRVHNWWVPLRNIWDDSEDFLTGGDDGNDSTDWPKFTGTSVAEGSLHDYLGIPAESFGSLRAWSALPARAYVKTYNEHYRDQDLISEVPLSTGNGTDTTTDGTVQKVSWEKDYFSTIRATQQKGSDVTISLGNSAQLYGDNMDWDNVDDSSNQAQIRDASGGSGNLRQMGTDGGSLFGRNTTSGTGEILADLSAATGMDVNDLRIALATQRFKEARARFGNRYVEYLRYLVGPGFRPSDTRLQNALYLGGGRQTVQFSEVLAHAPEASSSTVIGEMKGHGIAAIRTRPFRTFFEEHGLILTLLSVVPKAIYLDGVPRMFRRQTKEDYWQMERQHLGEQAVENYEVYVKHSSPTATFGYQGIYDEYRDGSQLNQVAGEFRSTLNYWHMARDFATSPSLNQTYIECNPTKRVLADQTNDSLWVYCNHSVQARRLVIPNANPRL